MRTDQSGAFEFVGLPAGDDAFEARVLGFEPLTEDVSVGVGESLHKNVALKIGTVQEAIAVTADREPDVSRQGSRVATARAPRPRPCPNPAVGGCIGPPVKVKDVRPLYPPALRESAMRGTVSIEGQIGTDGRMKDMRVISSPHPGFERAALDAVGEWEFTPTTLNGRVVDTRINVSVSFAPLRPRRHRRRSKPQGTQRGIAATKHAALCSPVFSGDTNALECVFLKTMRAR